MTTYERICTCGNWGGHDGDCGVFAPPTFVAAIPPPLVMSDAAYATYEAVRARVDALTADLAAERAENARLRSSLAFFAARFLAVAPRHEGSGGDRADRCAVCGDDADSHNAAEFGGGCGVCGDCPGFEPTP